MPISDSDHETLASCLDMQNKKEIAISQQSNNYVRIYSVELVKDWRNGSLLPELTRGSMVAMKEITRGTNRRTPVEICTNEYERLSSLAHENIVVVYEACYTVDVGDPSSLPYYLMENGECSLNFLLCSKHQNSTHIVPAQSDGSAADLATNIFYTKDHLYSWLMQVADAMTYLHSRALIHRDVKGPNVLMFDRKTQCKLCDFDTCRDIDPEGMTPKVGTDRWRAPELRKLQGRDRVQYNKACDRYSFGILMCEAIFRELPFYDYPDNAFTVCDADIPDLPPNEVSGAMRICKTNGHPTVKIDRGKSVFEGIPDEFWELLERLLSWEADRRPTFFSALTTLRGFASSCNVLPVIIVKKEGQRTDTGSLATSTVASRHRRYKTFRLTYSLSKDLEPLAQERLITILRDFSGNINVMASISDEKLQDVRHEYGFARPNVLIHDVKSADQQLVQKVAEYCRSDRKFTEWLDGNFKAEPNTNLRGVKFTVDAEQRPAEE